MPLATPLQFDSHVLKMGVSPPCSVAVFIAWAVYKELTADYCKVISPHVVARSDEVLIDMTPLSAIAKELAAERISDRLSKQFEVRVVGDAIRILNLQPTFNRIVELPEALGHFLSALYHTPTVPLKLKPEVCFKCFGLPGLKAVLAFWQIYSRLEAKYLLLTSANDSKHGYKSKHWRGDAIDSRVREPASLDWVLPTNLQRKAPIMIGALLGDDYDVLFEGDHIHGEFDPKAPVTV